MAEKSSNNESYKDSKDIEKDRDSLLSSSLNEVFDEGEIAQLNQLREIENIAQVARTLNKPEIFDGWDGLCIDCDEPVPKERILLSKTRCVECQQEFEDAQKRRMGISVTQTYIPAKISRPSDWQSSEKMEESSDSED